MVSTLRNLGPQLLGIVRTGAVQYWPHGSVTPDTLGITLPFSRSGQLGLSTAGQELLTDAVAPAPAHCTPNL